MTYDAIDPTVRKQIREAQDAEYEASTPGAGRWRELRSKEWLTVDELTELDRADDEFNIARRHRHGRAWEMLPVAPRALVRVWEAWVAGVALLVWVAWLVWVLVEWLA